MTLTEYISRQQAPSSTSYQPPDDPKAYATRLNRWLSLGGTLRPQQARWLQAYSQAHPEPKETSCTMNQR